jgi:hypothetical protein
MSSQPRSNKQPPIGCLTDELEGLRWRRRESNPRNIPTATATASAEGPVWVSAGDVC